MTDVVVERVERQVVERGNRRGGGKGREAGRETGGGGYG